MSQGGEAPQDTWAVGERYEAYVGRWSRPVAGELLRWLGVPPGARWLDVGCGTGTLAAVILEDGAPRVLAGVDRSRGFIAHARARLAGAPVASLPEDRRAALREAFRASLPFATDGSIALAARAWAVRGTKDGAART